MKTQLKTLGAAALMVLAGCQKEDPAAALPHNETAAQDAVACAPFSAYPIQLQRGGPTNKQPANKRLTAISVREVTRGPQDPVELNSPTSSCECEAKFPLPANQADAAKLTKYLSFGLRDSQDSWDQIKAETGTMPTYFGLIFALNGRPEGPRFRARIANDGVYVYVKRYYMELEGRIGGRVGMPCSVLNGRLRLSSESQNPVPQL